MDALRSTTRINDVVPLDGDVVSCAEGLLCVKCLNV